ncbi:MAG: zinc-binding alcohol dehydrogenase family protein [Cytophagales bacterium]|nr:zinc-binding alcohol dehydrogenase family protein [Cytophagales bacterium]
MKAAVTTRPGPPDVIQIFDLPAPTATPGWVLIRIKAFGLNRSELFTRRGDSPNVKFPRVQGIECVGLVEDDPSGTYEKGQKVAAIMGEMGREFDGGYAEYTLVPLEIVIAFESDLPWSTLGALPEMFQTVSGSLHEALEIKKGESLLIRGGTSSIGLMAGQLASHLGLKVISTTRDPARKDLLVEHGADHVIVDDGRISGKLKYFFPSGVEKVLELIGTRTLKDSLKCLGHKGTVCMTGILGNEWTVKEFTPMGDIPSLGKLTVYMGDSGNLSQEKLQEFIDTVEQGIIKPRIDTIFKLDQIVEAHEYMEANRAKGKLVVVI